MERQSPKYGNGFAGFGASTNEIIGLKFNHDLDSGLFYYVSFYLSLAESANCADVPIVLKIGRIEDGFFEDNDIVIKYTDAKRLLENSEWIKLSGTYKATGGENYISIMYYFDSRVQPRSSCFSYYFVDEIEVTFDSINNTTKIKNLRESFYFLKNQFIYGVRSQPILKNYTNG